MAWLKVWMSEPVTALKLLSLEVHKNDAIYFRSSSIRQLHFLGLICQLEAAATMPVFERERVL